MRNLLKKALKEAGYEVVGEAKNGKEGIKLYFELKPDIVTMDISMPDISGIEATKQILSKDPTAKIIAVTGNNNDDIKKEMMEAGAREYLQKPFQPAFLWSKLEKMLEEDSTKEESVVEHSKAPVVSTTGAIVDDAIEDDFNNMEIEIMDKPDATKSMTFVIENEEDVIEFPNQPEIEKERDEFQLSEENMKKHADEDIVLELEDNQTLTQVVEEDFPEPPKPVVDPPEIRQPVREPRKPSSPPPSPTREPSIREHKMTPRESHVEPQTPSVREPLVSTVEITKEKKTDRKIEEINIRPQQTSSAPQAPVNIRPPRGRVLREESFDRLDSVEIEEPILNVSDKDNYNNDKNGLIGIVKKLFKK